MSARVRLDRLVLGCGSPCARITMMAPRANAMEPNFLGDLHAALDEAEEMDAGAILLCGRRSFSSGGDVALFEQEVLAGRGEAFSREVVGGLQRLVLRLLSMPRVVAVAARGAVTGGAGGILFASDLAVLDPGAFVQPYYATLAFAPDGGWAAVLPERIGAGRALDWLMSDRRLWADDLRAMGLCRAVSVEPEETARSLLDAAPIPALISAKRLVWDAARLAAVEARLAAETEAFVARINTPEVARAMRRYLEKPARR